MRRGMVQKQKDLEMLAKIREKGERRIRRTNKLEAKVGKARLSKDVGRDLDEDID